MTLPLTTAQVALFLPAAVLVAASPGANNLLSLTHGIRVGMLPTVISLAGRFSAAASMIVAVALGLGAILETSEALFTIIKWIGVAYLAWLGVRMILSEASPTGGESETESVSLTDLVRREFTVALTNPKAPLLFTAFLPQFVRTDAPFAAQMMALGAVYIGVEFCAACGYAYAGTLVRKLEMTPRRSRIINRTTGGMMLGAAALLATTKRA